MNQTRLGQNVSLPAHGGFELGEAGLRECGERTEILNGALGE